MRDVRTLATVRDRRLLVYAGRFGTQSCYILIIGAAGLAPDALIGVLAPKLVVGAHQTS